MSDRLTLAAYRAGWRLVRALPERLAYLLFSGLAQVAWLSQGRGVRQLERNLARVMPHLGPVALKSLARKGMHSYLRYWCDAFRLPGWDAERIRSTCRMDDRVGLHEALATGRGAILALAHQGNWDHAGAWSTLELARVTTVAERLKPEELYQQFLAFRESLGMTVLPARGQAAFGPLVRTLREGGFVPLLVDRDLTHHGVPVTFFGERVRMAPGPAALALVTEAPLFPATIHYERLPHGSGARWGTVIRVHPQVHVPEGLERGEQIQQITQACADALAEGIRAYPQDWHMLQALFVDDLVQPSSD